jgi:hypothetical protein
MLKLVRPLNLNQAVLSTALNRSWRDLGLTTNPTISSNRFVCEALEPARMELSPVGANDHRNQPSKDAKLRQKECQQLMEWKVDALIETRVEGPADETLVRRRVQAALWEMVEGLELSLGKHMSSAVHIMGITPIHHDNATQ